MFHPEHVYGLEEETAQSSRKTSLAKHFPLGFDYIHNTLIVLIDYIHEFGNYFSISTHKHFPAPFINGFSVEIHDIVIFQNMFARVKIKTFYASLGGFERASDHAVFYRFVFGYAESTHHFFHHIRGKNPHEVVFQRYKKLCFARIALSARTTAHLIVNTTSFVPFRAENKDPSRRFYFFRITIRRGIAS